MHRLAVFILLLGITLAARLSGSISTTSPSTYTTIFAVNANTGKVFQTRTSSSNYNLLVSDQSTFTVYAYSSASSNVTGWTVSSFLPFVVGPITPENGTAVVDLKFEPAHTLVLVSYIDGTARKPSDFSRHTWTTDLSGITSRFYKTTPYSVSGQYTLGLAIPVGSRATIMSEIQLSSLGPVVISANNGGLGFGSDGSDGTGATVVQLNYEMARTASAAVKSKTESMDYATPRISFDALSAVFASEQARSVVADQVLFESLTAENTLELSRAEDGIRKFRTSNLTARATDESGRSVAGLTVLLEQTSTSIKFGVYGGQQNSIGLEAWKQLADSGVNAAVVDFWWAKIEPTNDTLEEDYVLNQKIGDLMSLGLSLRATGLFQPHPDVIPEYARGLDEESFGKALYDHVFFMVNRYCYRFDLIEVSTDLNNLVSLMGFDASQLLRLQQISLDAIRAAAPGVRTTVGGSNTFDPKATSSVSPAQFNKQWAAAGQQIDVIGQTLYSGASKPRYSLGTISDLLDSISSAGKPIRLSRVSSPFADPQEASGFLKDVYTIAYSKRYINEISWSGLLGEASLFHEDQTPTPLYDALTEFIRSKSSTSTMTFEDVTSSVTVYAGSFHVTVYKDGVTVGHSEVYLEEGRENKMSVFYRADGTATVLLNELHGPVMGVVPAPLPAPSPALDSIGSTGPSSKLPQWSIFVIIFGTVGVVSVFALLAALLVLRRSRSTGAPEASTGGPVGNVLPGKSFEIDLEAANPKPTALDDIPDDAPWRDQPLTASAVVLEESSDDQESVVDSLSDESSEMEDVDLDGQISTSTTDTEEEEHL